MFKQIVEGVKTLSFGFFVSALSVELLGKDCGTNTISATIVVAVISGLGIIGSFVADWYQSRR